MELLFENWPSGDVNCVAELCYGRFCISFLQSSTNSPQIIKTQIT